MVFMLCATLASLVQTILNKIALIGSGGAFWGDWFQLVFAAAMAILAVILVIQGVQTFAAQKKKQT